MSATLDLRVPGAVAIGRRRVAIELKQFFRDRNSAVFNFAFPMILLIIFGSVFGGQEMPSGITFAQYFVAGMIASGVLSTSALVTHVAAMRTEPTGVANGSSPSAIRRRTRRASRSSRTPRRGA